MIGADTSFLIDFLNGDDDAVAFMDEHKESIQVCELVVFEFLCGNLSDDERETFLAFIERFDCHDCDRNAVHRAAELFREGKRKGVTIAKPDALIAGSYIANGVDEIVTGDASHFREIQDCTVHSYSNG